MIKDFGFRNFELSHSGRVFENTLSYEIDDATGTVSVLNNTFVFKHLMKPVFNGNYMFTLLMLSITNVFLFIVTLGASSASLISFVPLTFPLFMIGYLWWSTHMFQRVMNSTPYDLSFLVGKFDEKDVIKVCEAFRNAVHHKYQPLNNNHYIKGDLSFKYEGLVRRFEVDDSKQAYPMISIGVYSNYKLIDRVYMKPGVFKTVCTTNKTLQNRRINKRKNHLDSTTISYDTNRRSKKRTQSHRIQTSR